MWNTICGRMTERLRDVLLRCPHAVSSTVTEIRLRAGQPLILVSPYGNYGLNGQGMPVSPEKSVFVYSHDVAELFLRLCDSSVYSHTDELRQGFLTTEEGCRVGIAGTAVTENGTVVGLRDPVGLNLRIPHDIFNAAEQIFPLMQNLDSVWNTLILSPPGGGKTTVLRDIARRCSAQGLKTCVMDERFELCGMHRGVSAYDLGVHCDVLSGYPKSVGILQAIRTLSPQVILCDEIGDEQDILAVERGLYCGVRFIVTAHGSDRSDLDRRPVLRDFMKRCTPERILILCGADRPGVLRDVIRTEDGLC